VLADDEIGHAAVIPDSLDGLPSTIRAIFDRFASATVGLVRKLGVPSCADALLNAERAVFGLVAKIADHITAVLVGLSHRADEGRRGAAAVAKSAEEERHILLRAHGLRPVVARFLGGSRIEMATPYWAPDHRAKPGPPRESRGASGGGAYPVLDHLGFVERATPALASEVARQSAALASFREAEDGLAARGINLDVKAIRRLSEHVGERALRMRDTLVEAFECGKRWRGGEFAGKRVAAVFDGGRTRTRVSGKRGRRRRKTRRRGFATPWREPKILALYEFDEHGKKVMRDPIYEGTFESWDDAFRIFAAECARRGVGEARELVVAGDGSPNIWDRVDGFVRAIGIDPKRVTRIIDFYHAREHVTKLASLCVRWSEKRRQHWIARVKRHLKAGRIEEVIGAGEALKIGRRSPAVEKALDYFRSRIECMRYAAFRARGLPIGTGVVESAIRRIVNLRLKGPGIFWEVDNAERMLVLRARLKSGRWSELEDHVFTPLAAAGWRRLLPRERTRAAA
jgi:hypothetical protein